MPAIAGSVGWIAYFLIIYLREPSVRQFDNLGRRLWRPIIFFKKSVLLLNACFGYNTATGGFSRICVSD